MNTFYGGSGSFPGKFLNLEFLKCHFLHFGDRFHKNSKGYKTPKIQLNSILELSILYFRTAHFIFRLPILENGTPSDDSLI